MSSWASVLLARISEKNLPVRVKAKYLLITSFILLVFNFFRILFFVTQQEWIIFFSGLFAMLFLILAIHAIYRGKPVSASNFAISSVLVNLVFNAVNSRFNTVIFEIFNYPYIESAFIYLTGLIFAGFLSFRIYQPIVFALISITVITLEYYNIHLKPTALYFHDKSLVTYVEYFIVLATAGFGTWLNLRINNRLMNLLGQEAKKVMKYNEKLEETVAERTSQLEEKTGMLQQQNQLLNEEITERIKIEKELTIAKERAEEASIAKEQFLSTVSHELRTPLNAVIGMAHLLKSEDLTKDQRDYVDTLGFSANQLLELINDVLDFSKIESGKMDVENEPFNFHTQIKNLLESFRFKAEENALELHFEWPDDLPRNYISDQQKLNQVFTNLINNAIKFTEKGSIVVKAERVREIKDKLMLRLSVQDTGIGIPQDKYEKIFEHFSQAASDTTRKYGGSGLGLAITKKLVELLGGSISVESQEGVGSSFNVVLALQVYEKNVDLIESKENIGTSLAGLRILLVEDNLINQKVARKIMSKWNLEVETASNGIEALEMFQNNTYDLILMDIQMPKMDGYETTRRIRQLESSSDQTPIIALTASALLNVKQKAQQIGMNDYVSKPFKPDELFNTINQYISR